MSNLLLLLLLLISLFTKSFCNEYCSLFSHHILCVYPRIPNDCPQFKERRPNEREQFQIVDWHNRMRQRVALGLERRGYGGPQPPASNMMKMKWDPELARMAQRWANQCIYQHSCGYCKRVIGDRFAVGESLARIEYTYYPKSFDFLYIIKQWYEDEVGYMSPSYVDRFEGSNEWGHYASMVWWNTRSVGCGGVDYVRKGLFYQQVVCHYGSSPGLPFTKVYEKGQPCLNCPLDTACDLNYYGLCAISKHPFNVTDAFPNTDQVYLGLTIDEYIDLK